MFTSCTLNEFMQLLESISVTFADLAWGPWLMVLLLGGGCYFIFYSRMLPFRYFRHAIHILMGRYDDPDDPGQISHFQALSSALAGTIGMGNIGGVAVAIQTGGPGAVFWMWVGAILGITTKFFTCTLAIQFRGPDSRGTIQGGPMYTILYGLGRRWKLLGSFFSFCALGAMTPLFQTNQLVQLIRESFTDPQGTFAEPTAAFGFNLTVGIIIACVTSAVIFGGILRIAFVASKVVPSMVVLYLLSAVYMLSVNYTQIPELFALIIRDAFTGEAVAGGVFGSVFVIGIRRSAFSNEAGIGTEAMAHGAAKTKEPIREGLVAMLGPVIDTLVVCSCTALIILSSGVWQITAKTGVSVTAAAFDTFMPLVGNYILIICVFFFSSSTILTQAYYGEKGLGFLIGAEHQHYYRYLYIAAILFSAVTSITVVINFIDGLFALMAIPTMVSALLLSPKVMQEARRYFESL